MRAGQHVEPDQVLHEVLTAAALCTDAHLMQAADGRWRITGDPTEGALLTLAAKAHLTKGVLESAEPRVAEIPFSSERKHMTTCTGAAPVPRMRRVPRRSSWRPAPVCARRRVKRR